MNRRISIRTQQHVLCGLVALVAILVGGMPACASDWTVLSTSTAGAGMPMSFGLESAYANPAHLGIATSESLEIRLVGAGAGIGNNGFGFGDYRQYNGTHLDDADKRAILSNVPNDGLQFVADAGATAFATRIGRWSLHTSAFGSARGRIDRDAVELILFGNAHQSAWEFENVDGEGLAAWKIALSHGRSIGQLAGGRLYAGFSIARIRGLYYGRTDETYADLATANSGLTGSANLDALTAEGGNGWGMDIGLAWEPSKQWIASFKIENAVHTIRWDVNTEVTHYDLVFDDLTVDNYEDSLWTYDDTTEPAPAFSRGLPPQLHLGLGRIGNRVKASALVSVGLGDRFAVSTTPRIAGGIEYSLLSILPLRMGIAAGGTSGFSVGWGAGLHVGPMRLDAGVRVDRGVWVGSGRGISGAVALDFAI